MTDLSTRLEVFSQFMDCVEVGVWHFDGEMQLIFSTAPEQELLSVLFGAGGARSLSMEYCRQNRTPGFGSDAASLSWIAAPRYVNDALTDIFLLGPVFCSASSEQSLSASLHRSRLDNAILWRAGDLLRAVPVVRNTLLLQYGVMLQHCLTGEKLKPSDLQMITTGQQAYPSGDAHEDAHHDGDYAMEQAIFQAVEEGNVGYVHPKEIYQRRTGLLCRSDPLRHAKNELVSCLTLITRAAIRGGLPEVSAYFLSDYYIQLGEASNNIAEVYQYIQEAFQDYTERVHKCKLASGRSKEIQSCISYLELHLGQKVTLAQLAGELGYNPNYLSTKFNREVGISVSAYALQLKLERAKVELQNTDRSIQTISDALDFGSVSYFSAQFRRETGQTPSDFRNRKPSSQTTTNR